MNSTNNAYTNTPRPHPNLFLGSLQLLVWLFFHPLAWRNYLAGLDLGLSPNFGLADLGRDRWRVLSLRRLLLQAHLVLPTLNCGLLGVMLALTGVSIAQTLAGVMAGLLLGIGVSLGGSLLFGTAGAVFLGVMAGLVATVAVGLQLGLGLNHSGLLTGTLWFDISALSLLFGLLVGLGAGLVGRVIGELDHNQLAYTRRQQLGGTVVGLLIGCGLLFAVGRGLAGDQVNELVLSLIVIGLSGLAVAWRRGRLAALVLSVALLLAFLLPGAGTWFSVLVAALLIPTYLLTERLAGPWPGVVAAALGGGGGWIAANIAASNAPLWPTILFALVGLLVGLTLPWWRYVVFYPFLAAWNTLLYYTDLRRAGPRPGFLRWHSAFWDEYQPLRLFGLPDHLLLVYAHDPAEGQAALDYLSTSRQRWAAQTTQLELDARALAGCQTIEQIGAAHRHLVISDLAGPAGVLLRPFTYLSQDVQAALEQYSAYHQRLALTDVAERLDSLARELTRSNLPGAARLHPVATTWRQTVAGHLASLTESAERRHELDNPYIFGPPLTERQEIFCGRTDVARRIEQLLRDPHRLPLLLYGQRRVGKTSLLYHLGRLLPNAVVPFFVDLQGAARASDHTGLLYNLSRAMRTSAQQQRQLTLPSLARTELIADPFTSFYDWLDAIEQSFLAAGHQTALLAFDEFEALDHTITQGRYDEADVLGMLRTLIQHRPRLHVLLAGSHAIEEFERWASYLINLQVVHLSYLHPEEARRLIERPVRDFALVYEPAATARILALTRGHPALIQLLCAEIVNRKNEQSQANRNQAGLADVEAAVPEASRRGRLFFADIVHNQVDQAGLELLTRMASQGEGAVVDPAWLVRQLPITTPDEVLTLLQHRDLIEAVDSGYRFQVELIRRWFVEVGSGVPQPVASRD